MINNLCLERVKKERDQNFTYSKLWSLLFFFYAINSLSRFSLSFALPEQKVSMFFFLIVVSLFYSKYI
jgi:hypothetical protein